MKKITMMILAGATVLAGVFTSCNRTLPEVENPNYNPDTKEVNANFVLNIATGSDTRMSGDLTQQNSNFRGMDNAVLIAYTTTETFSGAGDSNLAPVLEGDTQGKRFDLGQLAAASGITASNSRRIYALDIPVGTNGMLFYGKAIKGNNSDAGAGKIGYNVGSTNATTTFTLQPRISGNSLSALSQSQSLAALALTKILQVNDGGNPAKSWKDFGTLYGLNQNDDETDDVVQGTLAQMMGEAYYLATTIRSGENRAGSSTAILNMAAGLRTVLSIVTAASPVDADETSAKNVATAALAEFNKVFTYVESTQTTSWKAKADIIENLSLTAANYSAVADSSLTGYPECFGLPAGTSQLTYDSSAGSLNPATGSIGIGGVAVSPEKLMYPAELTYYCNGPIRTSSTEKTESQFPNGVANWNTDAQWTTGWVKNQAIASSTRAAALQPNINYGVAVLSSSVKLANVDNFSDNAHVAGGEESDNTIARTSMALALKGVLIGGQNNQVNWEFIPSGASYDYTIYDNKIAGGNDPVSIPTDGSTPTATNYTLVFDNYTSGNTQSNVNVALEIVNNGPDFWGEHNLIPSGSTFYLVGQLNIGGNEDTITFGELYQVPPVDPSTRKSTKTKRVFIQDYVTSATFTLGANALQHALVTVPDLRSSKLSFGLSVDIAWNTGVSFDVTIGQ